MRVYASAEMTLTDTNDGISVTGIDRYYMASSSSEGIKVGSQGWMPDPQETNPVSRYHWSYEVVNYSSGPPVPTKPAVIGVYGKEGIDAVTVSLSSEAHTFAGTESKAIASSITIDISAFKGSQRIPTSIGTVTGGIIGQLEHSELGIGTTSNKLVINVTNALDKSHGTLSIPIVADGKTFNKVFSWSVAFKGDTGNDGNPGKDGVGVQKTDIHYAKSTSGTTRPSTGWNLAVPSTSPGDYIWTRTTWTYTDGDVEEGYSVSRIGKDGNTGDDGAPGKDGVGIKETVINYAASSSGTTKPTSGWTPTIPSVTPGNYLWTRTTWTYTDNDVEEGYSVSRIGEKGDKGDPGPPGIPGDKGDDGQSQWVHIRYSANSNGASMEPNPSSTTKYVGIAVTNSATAPAYTGFTWSKYVGENGGQGPQGVQGPKGTNGTTTYTWVRYADTPTSGMNQYPEGKKYIGLAFNKATQTESNSYSDYQWSLMPQNIEIGGRNLIKRSDFGNIVPSGVLGVAVLNEDYPNGLMATGGDNQRKNYIEFPGVLSGNGWYTVSFLARGTQNGTRGLSVMIGDSPALTDGRISNTSNEYTYHTYSYKVENYNSETNNSIKIAELDYAYYRIDNIKLEKGNTATDWTEAPEDTQSKIDEKAGSTELNDTLTIVREEREKLGDLRTELQSTQSNLLITHSEEWMTTITETANGLGGMSNRVNTIEETKEQIDTFFQFDDALTIAKSNAQTKLRLTNDEIQFLDGETKGTYITGNNMVTQNLTIQDKLNLPNHTMESQEDLTIIRFIG